MNHGQLSLIVEDSKTRKDIENMRRYCEIAETNKVKEFDVEIYFSIILWLL